MIGIYYIKCKLNKKVYIGSSINIKQRFEKHFYLLKYNKHTNRYLQNVYNKYGFDSFNYGIIEFCKEEILLEREQYYIDNNKNLLNIVLIDVTRPSLDKETRDRISNTINERIKNGIIPRFNKGNFKKNNIPWNKGKKYDSTEHLKVSKTITLAFLKGRKSFSKTLRENAPEIYVYNLNNKFLGKWRSSKDLEEYSLNKNCILKFHMILRNKLGRNEYSPYILKSITINKSIKTNKPYKGLIFKTVPL